MIRIGQANGKDALFLSTCGLGHGVCQKIRDFRTKLQTDADARQQFRNALGYGRSVECDPHLWEILRNQPYEQLWIEASSH